MTDTATNIIEAEGGDAAAPAVRIPITIKHHIAPPDSGPDDLVAEARAPTPQSHTAGGEIGGGEIFLVDIVGSSAAGGGADPVGDTLVFIAEPDAPGASTVYPEVEIHFCSTVGNRETAEREIYLKYELEATHDEPLPEEDPLIILEIESM